MATLEEILNPTGAVQQPKNSELYKVSYKDSKSGVYKSVVRFVPNVFDPSKCIVQKYVSWVKNPVTKMGMFVDCPPRESGLPSPVSELYFKLWNTKVQSYMDYAKEHLGSKLQYASLVQIVQDEQHPELVGQIKVFTYGKKIWDKLHYEEFPNAGTGTNPFHPIYGRRFSIVCTAQSGFNNFDQSCFYDEKNGNQITPSGLWFVDQNGQTSVATENCDMQVLVDYLKANSPDLTRYEYQPWNDEQKKHVDEVLTIINNFITTGSVGTANQVVAQQANNVLNNVNTNPVFPGATPPAPSAPVSPVFPGATQSPVTPNITPNINPTTPQAPQVSPVFPGATPPAPSQPQVSAPVMPQMPPQMTPGTVTGVDVPNVAPSVAPSAPQKPSVGINVDDILNNL